MQTRLRKKQRLVDKLAHTDSCAICLDVPGTNGFWSKGTLQHSQCGTVYCDVCLIKAVLWSPARLCPVCRVCVPATTEAVCCKLADSPFAFCPRLRTARPMPGHKHYVNIAYRLESLSVLHCLWTRFCLATQVQPPTPVSVRSMAQDLTNLGEVFGRHTHATEEDAILSAHCHRLALQLGLDTAFDNYACALACGYGTSQDIPRALGLWDSVLRQADSGWVRRKCVTHKGLVLVHSDDRASRSLGKKLLREVSNIDNVRSFKSLASYLDAIFYCD